MLEVELKFQVPTQRLAAVRRAMAGASLQTTRLRARYYDTPDRRLAQAHIALRLRQEGERWVQTLKAPGSSALARLEHEVERRSGDGDDLQLDLQLHAHTPAAEALLQALGCSLDEGMALVRPRFETDVLRHHRVLRSGGAQVELALDLGEVRAGDLTQPLCELELELKSGPLAGLMSLAAKWSQRHGLWLDSRTKSERGDRLARGLPHGRTVTAQAPSLHKRMTPEAALRAMVGACLAQIVPNASALASDLTSEALAAQGPALQAAAVEQVHQLRVGLRRLRTVLREFGAWSTRTEAGWSEQLAALFGALGETRDQDVLRLSLLPALKAAGAPPPPQADNGACAPSDFALLRDPGCTQLWLALMAFAHEEPAVQAHEDAGPALRPLARARLHTLWRAVAKDAKAFRSLDDEARHRCRKRLKRLRYALELTASLFPAKAVRQALDALRPAQEALGDYNDLCIAQAHFQQAPPTDPHACFALGWLAAQRPPALRQAHEALQGLRDLNLKL